MMTVFDGIKASGSYLILLIVSLYILYRVNAKKNQWYIYYALGYGLLFDFFNSKILFIHGIIFLIITFILSEIYHSHFENMISVKGIFAVIGCFVYSFLFAVFFGLRGADFIKIFINISLVEFLYNSLFSVAGIFLYRKILKIRPSAWRVRWKTTAISQDL